MKRKIIFLMVAMYLLTGCVSRRKTASEVMRIKTEEITSETTREERKTISEWIKELSGSIVISEVEYYPPTDTVQSPQHKGAIKAERKTMIQLSTTEQAKDLETEETVTDKVTTRDEDTHRETKTDETIKVGNSYTKLIIITSAVIGIFTVLFLRDMIIPRWLRGILRVFRR